MFSTARRRLTAVAGLAAGAALLAGGLAGPAMASPTAGSTAAASAARPKPAPGGDPTITIRVGGVRTAENGPPGPPIATGLAGVTFRVTPASTGFADTCVSTAAGACTLQVSANRTYTVTQAGTPAGWFDNPSLATGSGAAVVSRVYNSLRVAVGNANLTIPAPAPNSDTSPTARSGTWALSKDDPPLPAVCGLRIALLIDLSGSVSPNLATYKAAARAFVESLAGTPSTIAIFTYGTNAPAPGANNATLPPVSVAAPAGVARLVSKINGLTVPASSGTNWDAGLWQIAGITRVALPVHLHHHRRRPDLLRADRQRRPGKHDPVRRGGERHLLRQRAEGPGHLGHQRGHRHRARGAALDRQHPGHLRAGRRHRLLQHRLPAAEPRARAAGAAQLRGHAHHQDGGPGDLQRRRPEDHLRLHG